MLSGGGARGAAHVGVLQALEAQGIRPDCVAGASMGAIIGALYSAGYPLDEIYAVIAGLNLRNIYTEPLSRSSMPIMHRLEQAGRRSASDSTATAGTSPAAFCTTDGSTTS